MGGLEEAGRKVVGILERPTGRWQLGGVLEETAGRRQLAWRGSWEVADGWGEFRAQRGGGTPTIYVEVKPEQFTRPPGPLQLRAVWGTSA